ncbi:MAG TPA: transketolase C-terminal domain-containing protein [Candidatus Omnitrophota bacterium]|nr:alpha-ketoacid dehydrogenase subunit beta [Candidatus Omnitrophota bacterium]HQO57175.1 transketolase C-terminal domain-containing protein [Candidatus Omnitrophota bacterium]HQP12314.1 transketolase C-terminal domain-containing protein [Candidatus Omnitrophota bacterium]
MPWTKLQIEREEPAFDENAGQDVRKLSFGEALREALDQALARDPRVYAMGQGIDDPGGIFGTTLGLREKYGPRRIFDTPLAEEATIGMAIGSAMAGLRPVSIHNRPDFLMMAMDQIVNAASKWCYMFSGQVPIPLVIRACIGRGWGSAAQHSQSLHGLFTHVPGLKIVMPSTAYDAKGLFIASVADPNPVLFIEHRWLYQHKGYVPQDVYAVPFGQGTVKRPGRDITVIAISHMVIESLRAAEQLEKKGISLEVIDPRTLCPFDEGLLLKSLEKTGKLMVADVDWKTSGFAAEVVALAAEKGFSFLKKPPVRVCLPDIPTPASYVLEEAFYPGVADIVAAAERLMA